MNKLILTAAIMASSVVVSAKNNIKGEPDEFALQQQNHIVQSVSTNKGAPSFVTVGDTNDCDFRLGATKIQDALDFAKANGTDEVRVTHTIDPDPPYMENITIDDFSVALRGGFADCAAAVSNDVSGLASDTIINGSNNASPVITIIGSTQRNTVRIENLQATGGSDFGFATSGGISTVLADLALNLTNVSLVGNSGNLGGGLAVVSGNTDVIGFNVMIAANSATNGGGGLYCTGAEASITLNGSVDNGFGIGLNQVTAPDGNGGGAFIDFQCRFSSYVGTDDSSLFDLKGIVSNSATGHGGGIYAEEGAKVFLYGTSFFSIFPPFTTFGYNSEPININLNTANSDGVGDGDGGGIYAAGANTEVKIYNGLIQGNTASNGAGIAASDTADVEANAQYTAFSFLFGNSPIDCWSPGSCMQIADNQADTGNQFGGAVFAESGGTVDINRAHIQGNRADFGTALYAIDTGSNIEVEGSLISGNGDFASGDYLDNNVIRAINDSTIDIEWSTVADNNIDPSDEIVANNSADVFLSSSIFHETNGVDLYERVSPMNDHFRCLLVHDGNYETPNTEFNVNVDDPSFIDRSNGDYHIDWATSPAMDYCNGNFASEFNDIDDEQRGWDWSGISNNSGPYDIGFDEQNDLIFYNGFEAPPAP